MRSKRHAILIPLILSFFALVPNHAHAAEQVSVYLTTAAIERGYTLKTTDSSAILGIFPGVLTEPSTVTITPDEHLQLATPDGMEQVSGQFVYDMSMENPRILPKPVVVSLSYASTTPWLKKIAFYDRIHSAWQTVPTWPSGDGRVRAFLPFPYSRVAVFEQTGVLTALSLPHAQAAAIINADTGVLIGGTRASDVFSLASLTKLATALVVLDTHPDWSKVITYQTSDERGGAMLPIRIGEQLTVRDLFYASLVASTNNATVALARSTGLSPQTFVQRMRDKAAALGLTQTSFFEPTGLDPRNQSTAYEYALLSRAAFRNFAILQATTARGYAFTTLNTKRAIRFKTTDELLMSPFYVTGGKTGYLPEIGYNMAFQVRGGGRTGTQNVLTLLLGAPTSATRFSDTYSLANLGLQLLDTTP